MSAVCLIAVIRGLNWRVVWSTLQVANGYWLSLALIATLASIPARAIRWAVLLGLSTPADGHIGLGHFDRPGSQLYRPHPGWVN